MTPETATFDDSLSITARKTAETWVTVPVTPNSPSVLISILLISILVLITSVLEGRQRRPGSWLP
jgi:hypothetical protein